MNVVSANTRPVFRCPGCKKPVSRTDEAFPFCSERCELIDLGCWAAGDYRIPGETAQRPLASHDDY